MNANRRLFFKQVGGWAAGGVVGQFAYDRLAQAAQNAGRRLDDLARDLTRSVVGKTILVPVWTGTEMVVVECDFSETETGYHIFGRRVVRRLSDGAKCAEAGREMVEMGLLLMQEVDLEITTDFEQVEGLYEAG